MRRLMLAIVSIAMLAACSSSSGSKSTSAPSSTAVPVCSDFFGHQRGATEWNTSCTIASSLQVATEFRCGAYPHDAAHPAPASDLFQNGHGYGFADAEATAVTGDLTKDAGYQSAYRKCTGT